LEHLNHHQPALKIEGAQEFDEKNDCMFDNHKENEPAKLPVKKMSYE
jgi:hypothetical protein